MNISFDPSNQARGTQTLQVEMVRRVFNNEVIEVDTWLSSQTDGDIHTLRTRIRQKMDDARFVCFCCGHEVRLRKHESGGHYFAHIKKDAAEKDKCLYQQQGLISIDDRNRIRYHGQREGSRHIKTKELIESILKSDSNFNNIKVEQVWTTFADGWRKPDVSANWNETSIVFEAQVSNTYPQVVADRTDFYRKQGSLLIWIYDRLIDEDWRTLHSDNFCSNGQHLFYVDDECLEISQQRKKACFKIYTQYPDVIPVRRIADKKWELEIHEVKNTELIPFSDLSLNIEKQTAVYYDVEQKKWAAEHKLICAKAQSEYSEYSLAELEKSIRVKIGSTRVIERDTLIGWALLICAIESKCLGVAIGTKFPNPDSVLNLLYDRHPKFLCHLIKVLELLNLESDANRTGAWKERVSLFRNERYKKNKEIVPLPDQHTHSFNLLGDVYPQFKNHI
jgi:competence CoiA-like predicted nuclease